MFVCLCGVSNILTVTVFDWEDVTWWSQHIGSDARSEDCLISDGPPPVDDSLPKIGGLSASDCLPPQNSEIGLIMRSNVKRSLVWF